MDGVDRRARSPAYVWMDVLRLAAAVEVVLYHVIHRGLETGAINVATPWLRAVLYYGSAFGQEAVLVFFVLSGFWIAAAVDRLKAEPQFWQVYLARRMSRLLVVLVPALLLGGAMDLYGAFALHAPVYQDGSAAAWGAWAPIAPTLHGTVLIGNLLFLQNFALPPLGSNAALWSLSSEFWYYLIYPACLLAWRRRFTIPLLSLALLVLWPSLAAMFPIWLMGAALYHADRAVPRGTPGPVSWIAVPLGCAALLATLSVSRFLPVAGMAGDWLVGLGTVALLSALLRHPARPPARIEPLARLGASGSYSLYLTHMPLAIMLGALAGAVGMPDSIGLRLCITAVALVWGWLFSCLFESRTDMLRRLAVRLLSKPGAVPVVATYRG